MSDIESSLSEEAACILVYLRRFDVMGTKDIVDFDSNDPDIRAALRTVNYIRQQFRALGVRGGFHIFLDQLRYSFDQTSTIYDWLLREGFSGSYIKLKDVEKCPYKIDIMGLLKSLPLSASPSTSDPYDERSVAFLRKFAEEHISPLLKQNAIKRHKAGALFGVL